MNIKMLERAKPILMSTPMVQASMSDVDPKTQTRRVVKIPKWTTSSYDELFIDANGNLCATCDDTGCDVIIKPRYQSGDILWVRETWLKLDSCKYCMCDDEPAEQDGCYLYYATHGDAEGLRWKPSIHMPRKAARLFLRVTDVRAERLQDIGILDIQREGVQIVYNKMLQNEPCDPGPIDIPATKHSFARSWDKLNAKRDGGEYAWDMNPWVWVYTFERCEYAS